MPNSVIFSGFVEALLILATLLLLSKPKTLFRTVPQKMNSMLTWGGFLFLCLTFCWSVVFGIVLSVNHLSLRF